MKNCFVTITANPSIDKMLCIDNFMVGEINRPQRSLSLAGGKGLNVSRVLNRLGVPLCACVLLGGYCGRWIEGNLKEEKIQTCVTWGDGETRTCFSIINLLSGETTSVYEQGFMVTPKVWYDFEDSVESRIDAASAVIISGSLPPGAPVDGYARLIRRARVRSVPVLLDTYGEALKIALPARPWVLKINAEEAGDITGRVIKTFTDAVCAAQVLHDQGIPVIVVTLGSLGSVAVSTDGIWAAAPPAIKTLSAVGSGDAFLAGLSFALLEGSELPQALRLGTAAGAANAASFGTGNIDVSLINTLSKQVNISKI
ncbi:MAG: 1-phosphofructokinase family hexose kinase [Bacillota bacterium]